MDLHGKILESSPNPVVPRWGLMPGVTSVKRPILLLRKTSWSKSRGTILVLPGGGYHALAVMHEGLLVTEFLNNQGFDAAILEYSIGAKPSVRNRALRDAHTAWRLLRDRGHEWGLAKPTVGVMGFSAGGHLAARLVHESRPGQWPPMVMLIYPAYLEEHAGPQGIDPGVAPPKDCKSRVFVLIGNQDKPQWVIGAKAYAEACKQNGQWVDFHLLPGAGHGFGMKPDRTGSASQWERLLAKFLKTSTP